MRTQRKLQVVNIPSSYVFSIALLELCGIFSCTIVFARIYRGYCMKTHNNNDRNISQSVAVGGDLFSYFEQKVDEEEAGDSK